MQKLSELDPSFLTQCKLGYSGKGSVDDAANFVGVMPSKTPDDRINWIGNDLFQSQSS
jgi:feruloyl esterase